MRRRKRNNTIVLVGLLALLSALGLIAIVSFSSNPLTNLDPTAHQRTVDVIVQTRLALTAAARTLTPDAVNAEAPAS